VTTASAPTSDDSVSSPALTDNPLIPPGVEKVIPPARLARLVSMANHRVVWALADQAILSGGNFLTSYVLVRALPEAVYGEYALVLTFILFLNNLHTALITYPLSVTAAIGDGADLAMHARRSLRLTLALFAPLGLILAVATGLSARAAVIPWAVAALVLWQLQETVRRSMMARLQNRRAIAGDLLSYLGQAGIVAVLARMGLLTVPVAFAMIAATSGVGFVVQAVQLRLFKTDRGGSAAGSSPGQPSRASESRTGGRAAPVGPLGISPGARLHWSLGKWVLLTNVVNLLTFYSAPWVLTYFHGKTEFAELSVVAMLLNASNPVLSTIAGLITPAVAKTNAEKGPAAARRTVVPYALMGVMLLLPYYGMLAVFPHWVLVHFKPDSQYTGLSTPVRLYVGIYLLLYGTQVLSGYLGGIGKTRFPFYAQSTAAIVTAIVTLPLTIRYGLLGAAWGGLAPMVGQLLVCAFFVRRLAVHERKSIPHPVDDPR
jgi:O-antigen/teichoic acid export membrane protein